MKEATKSFEYSKNPRSSIRLLRSQLIMSSCCLKLIPNIIYQCARSRSDLLSPQHYGLDNAENFYIPTANGGVLGWYSLNIDL